MCHLVLLLPVFGLASFWLLPPLEAAFVYLIILGVSLLLYQSVLEAMRLPVAAGPETLLGRTGVVERVVGPRCTIQLGGELFTAWVPRGSSRELEEGAAVVVTGLQGSILEIEPART